MPNSPPPSTIHRITLTDVLPQNETDRKVEGAVRPKTLPLRKSNTDKDLDLPEKKSFQEISSSSSHGSLYRRRQTPRELKIISGAVFERNYTSKKIEYCCGHLNSQINIFQKCLSEEVSLENEDELFKALAELKRIRDILNGTLRFLPEIPVLKNGIPGDEND